MNTLTWFRTLSGEDISQFATPDKDLNGANLRDVKLSGRKSLLGRNLAWRSGFRTPTSPDS